MFNINRKPTDQQLYIKLSTYVVQYTETLCLNLTIITQSLHQILQQLSY